MGRRPARVALTRAVDGGLATLVPDPDHAEAWTLLVDGTQQSHVDLADPTHLGFEYTRRIGHVIDLMPPGPLRALHLGGGGMALARYVGATRPGSRNLVVESDAALVDLVRGELPWSRRLGIRVRTAEARSTVEALPDGSADLVVLDVFASARTPGNLTSVEAFGQVARVLAGDGTFVANIADESPLRYARSFVAGVAEVFSEVAVVAEPGVLRGRRFGNLVVVARRSGALPIDVAALARRCAGDPWPARVLDDEETEAFVARHRPYTDAVAPGSPEPPPGVFGRL